MIEQDISSWVNNSAQFDTDKHKVDLKKVYSDLLKGRENKTIPFLTNIDFSDDIHVVDQVFDLLNKFEKVLVLGTGGSTLGGRAIVSSASVNNLKFIENIDPVSINYILENINFEKTGILVISKSGFTIETIILATIFFEKFKAKVVLKNHVISIIEDFESDLANLCKSNDIKILQHAKDLGGRYSCLSSTALAPAALAGMKISYIKTLAKNNLDYFLRSMNTMPFQSAREMLKLINSNIFFAHAIIGYGDNLWPIILWFRQLWAESLGKNGLGLHPIPGVGAIDQHSQLQLWLDGPNNLIYTIILPHFGDDDIQVPSSPHLPDYLINKKAGHILRKMGETTVSGLIKAGRPVRIINIRYNRIEDIVQLMISLMLETVTLASLLNVNAYDQPAVDIIKKRIIKSLRNQNV